MKRRHFVKNFAMLGAVAGSGSLKTVYAVPKAKGISGINDLIGFWSADQAGLPCFRYTGKLPFKAVSKSGQPVKIPFSKYPTLI